MDIVIGHYLKFYIPVISHLETAVNSHSSSFYSHTKYIYIYIHPYKTVGLSPLLFLIVSQIISIQKWLLPSRHPIILLIIHYEIIPYHVPTHEKYQKKCIQNPFKIDVNIYTYI